MIYLKVLLFTSLNKKKKIIFEKIQNLIKKEPYFTFRVSLIQFGQYFFRIFVFKSDRETFGNNLFIIGHNKASKFFCKLKNSFSIMVVLFDTIMEIR